MKILERSKRITEVDYRLCFDLTDFSPGTGYSFRCDPNGNVFVDQLLPAARINYVSCINGTHNVHPPYVQRYEHTYRTYTKIRCDCGTILYLNNADEACPHCHQLYNCFGQRLSHPRYWGEETGEHFS